ncbi:SIMPL domain-containing protein [Candidatus Woesebacteria bacterium]|nr:SIMPL domain-containing protein [Candidatus Woesebacteria bacterium]
MQNFNFSVVIRYAAGLTVFLLVVMPFVKWGTVMSRSPETITVSASAQMEQKNEIAQFYAGVTASNADKQIAIDEVNKKMTEVMGKLKEFGIPESDIKTQSVSVYQDQEQVNEGGRQRYVPGSWRANNSIQIKLKDGTRTSDLLAVLSGSGLTDISGPNFMVDPMNDAPSAELLQKAVDKARVKADALAQASGRTVTKVLNITEGGSSYSYPMMDKAMGGMGGGAPVELGTSTMQTSVTVVFEMK